MTATEDAYRARIEEVSSGDEFVAYLKGKLGLSYELIWNSYFAEEFTA